MIVYLDTSSLVKLYVREDGSDDVARLVGQADVVATSVVAYPETRSAFARLARERVLDADGLAAARSRFQRDWGSFLRVRVLDRVYRRAGDLVDQHALRGFDALHLASFLEVLSQAAGEAVELSAFDARLNEAAVAARQAATEAPSE